MAEVKNERCATCVHFEFVDLKGEHGGYKVWKKDEVINALKDKTKQGWGRCHRFPPKIFVDDKNTAWFPPVLFTDYCGEYKRNLTLFK